MSSKNKLTKVCTPLLPAPSSKPRPAADSFHSPHRPRSQFKFAVAASSSSTPTSSRHSCPPSSSSITHLIISQQNILQTIHQEQLARLASTTLPNLASLHSQRFLRLARSQVAASDTLWTTRKLQAVTYRRSLWAEDIEPEQEGDKGKEDARIVPDFYRRHNPRCVRCSLPLVAGLNQTTTPNGHKEEASRLRAKAGRGTHGTTRKRISSCTLCRHKTRT